MLTAVNNQANDLPKNITSGGKKKHKQTRRKTNLKNVNLDLVTCECHTDSTKTVRTPEW